MLVHRNFQSIVGIVMFACQLPANDYLPDFDNRHDMYPLLMKALTLLQQLESRPRMHRIYQLKAELGSCLNAVDVFPRVYDLRQVAI